MGISEQGQIELKVCEACGFQAVEMLFKQEGIHISFYLNTASHWDMLPWRQGIAGKYEYQQVSEQT
jgi:hypothetical protein